MQGIELRGGSVCLTVDTHAGCGTTSWNHHKFDFKGLWAILESGWEAYRLLSSFVAAQPGGLELRRRSYLKDTRHAESCIIYSFRYGWGLIMIKGD